MTAQTQCDSRREIERGKRELKEDEATFALVEPTATGMPIPFLVNPQSDTTPPIRARQVAKRAIDFNLSNDFWCDDAALQQHPTRPTATERRRRMFIHDDGQRTVISSEAGSPTPSVRPPGFKSDAVLRQRALDTLQQEGAAKEDQSQKKEGDGEEHMDVSDVQDFCCSLSLALAAPIDPEINS
ncbi:MAG: hypothetical protein GY835_03935, partial [bacterium]|nr:hypothetical protein [bacterium]